MRVSDPTATPLLAHVIMRPFLATVVSDDVSTPPSLLSNTAVKLPSLAVSVTMVLPWSTVTVKEEVAVLSTVHCRLVVVAEQVSVITSSAHGLPL